VQDIITVLTTDASEWEKRPALRVDNAPADANLNWLVAVIGGLIIIGMIISPTFRWFVLTMLWSIATSSGSSSSSSGGWSSGGGGFSGGGGSSGGGGASGSW